MWKLDIRSVELRRMDTLDFQRIGLCFWKEHMFCEGTENVLQAGIEFLVNE